ncbi:fat storage-inducing transmembrane protein 1 [Synchiropus picturatus]
MGQERSEAPKMEILHKMVAELMLVVRFTMGILHSALVFGTNVTGRIMGSNVFRRHFHLLLSCVVLFGPLLSFWVSKYSIFANGNHWLYRKFLRSTWGWTSTLTGSFIVLVSLSARHPPSTCLRHLSRIALAGSLLWTCQRVLTLLEDAAGTCYEPIPAPQDVQTTASPDQPLLVLHQEQTKASCLRNNMLWNGYEVSRDVLILCLCCLLLVEELSVFGRSLTGAKRSAGGPLRFIFLLCVFLLALWLFLLLCRLAHFPQFPSQQLGGALGYLAWRGLYQGWYRLRPGWGSPGLPDEGMADTGKSEL